MVIQMMLQGVWKFGARERKERAGWCLHGSLLGPQCQTQSGLGEYFSNGWTDGYRANQALDITLETKCSATLSAPRGHVILHFQPGNQAPEVIYSPALDPLPAPFSCLTIRGPGGHNFLHGPPKCMSVSCQH